tara:strand:- start:54 stop:602 length:549 start_codon:yes stop_codon:yes gene_type:complete
MSKLKMLKNKKAQVWVETVIYTLIGLVIIGIVLAVATPAIDKYRDNVVIEQTLTVMNDLNNEILDVRDMGLGNKRIIPEFRIKKGTFTVEGAENKLIYVLEETKIEYSELDEVIEQGDINILTEKIGRKYNIRMEIVYDNIDLTSNGADEKKIVHKASSPYQMSVENTGEVEEKTKIDIRIS